MTAGEVSQKHKNSFTSKEAELSSLMKSRFISLKKGEYFHAILAIFLLLMIYELHCHVKTSVIKQL